MAATARLLSVSYATASSRDALAPTPSSNSASRTASPLPSREYVVKIFVPPPTHRTFVFFFLNDTPPPEIYPLPLHAALPICPNLSRLGRAPKAFGAGLLARRSEGAHRALTGTQNLLLLADVVPNSRWWNASTLVGRTTHPQIGRAHV